MNYYLLSNDPYTNLMLSICAVACVALVLMRGLEVWLDLGLRRDTEIYYSSRIADAEERIDKLERRLTNVENNRL